MRFALLCRYLCASRRLHLQPYVVLLQIKCIISMLIREKAVNSGKLADIIHTYMDILLRSSRFIKMIVG